MTAGFLRFPSCQRRQRRQRLVEKEGSWGAIGIADDHFISILRAEMDFRQPLNDAATF